MATTAAAKQVDTDSVESRFLYDALPIPVDQTRFASSSLFVLADLVLGVASGLLGLGLQFHESPAWVLSRHPAGEIAPSLLLLPLLVVLFCHSQCLYRAVESPERDKRWAILKAVGSAWIVLAVYLYLSEAARTAEQGVALSAVVSTGVLLLWHLYARSRALPEMAGGGLRHALILGEGGSAQRLRDYLSAHKERGYFVRGFVSGRPDTRDGICMGAGRIAPDEILGTIDELKTMVRACFIDELLIAQPADRHVVRQAVALARECGISVRVVADLYGGIDAGVRVEPLGPFPTLLVHAKRLPTLGLALKRLFDILLAGSALLANSFVFLLISIAIKLDSPGPVLYRSTRVGRKGATFPCLKFRTMIQEAEALQDKLRDRNERDGVLFKIEKDPRITRAGRFLRKYSLDELPQLWNVLRGEMSLVGPRPSLPSEVVQYELSQLKRLDIVPGITGLWQVKARRDPSFENYIKFDAEYVDHWSLWLDMKILFRTFRVVLEGTGQ